MDIVIPLHRKDSGIVDLCIDNIRKYISGVGIIYCISDKKYTDNAVWINDGMFPFSLCDIRDLLEKKDQAGWYFQQIIQFYMWDTIDSLSDNVMLVNSDVVFMRPILTMREKIYLNYCDKIHQPYRDHMQRLLPYIKLQKENGTVHYSIYNKSIMEDIVVYTETTHNMPFWKAYMSKITQSELNASSEFDLYFNYVFSFHADKYVKQKLKYEDKGDYYNWREYQKQGNDYVAFHAYMRPK